jgi:hypothetical protein
MVANAIKCAKPNAEDSLPHSQLLWLKEIAYQFALYNETVLPIIQAEHKRSEENRLRFEEEKKGWEKK